MFSKQPTRENDMHNIYPYGKILRVCVRGKGTKYEAWFKKIDEAKEYRDKALKELLDRFNRD